MKKKILLLTAVIISSHLYAQLDSTKSLEQVVITANKYSRKQSETGKVITIIGKSILENSFGRSLADVLNQQTSLVVPGAQNAFGSNQEPYLRGSGKILLLIDGVPAYDASYINGGFDLNNLPVESIERIEIVKGGQSTLYGSDAVAGVVNIISKKSGSKPFGAYGGISAGSYSTFKGNLGINGRSATTTYNVNYNGITSKGFSAATDTIGKKSFDKDGFKQNALTANLTHQFSKKLQARLNAAYSHYNGNLDGTTFTDDKDYTSSVSNAQAGINLQYKTKKGAIYFNANFNNSERKYVNDSFDISGFAAYTNEKYKGNSAFTELYTAQTLSSQLELLVGADYRAQNSNQDYLSISSYGPYKTNIGNDSVSNTMYSAFASLLFKNAKGLNVEMGSRFNHHSLYGNNVTYTLNPSYNINARWKLFANISSAFKAPSLYQLFAPEAMGNRQLQPERSVTYEGGLQFADATYNLRAVYFYRTIKDAIDYNLASNAYFNNNQQKDQGLELEGELKAGKLSLRANYSYLTGSVNTWKFVFNENTFGYDINGDTSFNNLFRRPKHALNATAQYQVNKKLLINSSLHFLGKRFEGQFAAIPVALKAYATVDVYAAYQLNSRLRAFADLRNITNTSYVEIWGYNSRRFNMTAGINFIL